MSKLQVGDLAPDFSAPDQDGNVITLSALKGNGVVLYFYPKDDTPGCTAEACSLRDHYSRFLAEGITVLGVSPDSEKKHQKFIEKYSLPFSLIADTTTRVAQDYGVWGKKKFMGREYMGILRTTFIIGPDRRIVRIISDVDTKNHADQILN